jgi:hypothetical protein
LPPAALVIASGLLNLPEANKDGCPCIPWGTKNTASPCSAKDYGGADPGPACYDRGSDEPTVTDANVVLQTLNPAHLLGGRMNVRQDLARTAIDDRFADTYDNPELGRALDVAVEVTIAGNEMRLHFYSPPQVRAGINMIYTILLSSVYYAVKAVVDPTILPNSGLARPITLTAPLGT